MAVVSRTAVGDAPHRHRGVLASGAASTQLVVPLVIVVADLIVLGAVILAASFLREHIDWFGSEKLMDDYVARMAVPVLVLWVLAMAALGAYRPALLGAGADLYKSVIQATFVTAGLVAIICFLFRIPLSRGFYVLAFAIGMVVLLPLRFAERRALHMARRRGLFRFRVLIAGEATHIDALHATLDRESWLGYHLVGGLRAQGQAHEESSPGGVRYVGDAFRAADAALRLRADVLIVTTGAFASPVELRRAQWALEEQRVQVVVAPGVTDVAPERVRIRPVAGLPLINLDRPRGQAALRSAKRIFDLLGACVILVAASPLIAFAALRIRLHDDGPLLFRQVRIGRDGQPFAMLKLRTMVVDADQLLPGLIADGGADQVLFKMREDPRVTRPGRWMRRYSVDEVPQLINVLRGEMSLVGPRPALPEEVSRYDADVSRRLRVRPGMTGLWQVSGRSELSWDDTVRLDLFYVDNWSMVADLLILLRTFRAVFGSSGAY